MLCLWERPFICSEPTCAMPFSALFMRISVFASFPNCKVSANRMQYKRKAWFYFVWLRWSLTSAKTKCKPNAIQKKSLILFCRAEVKPNFGEAKVQTETFDDSSSLGSNNGILIKKSANSFDLNKLKNKKSGSTSYIRTWSHLFNRHNRLPTTMNSYRLIALQPTFDWRCQHRL